MSLPTAEIKLPGPKDGLLKLKLIDSNGQIFKIRADVNEEQWAAIQKIVGEQP